MLVIKKFLGGKELDTKQFDIFIVFKKYNKFFIIILIFLLLCILYNNK